MSKIHVSREVLLSIAIVVFGLVLFLNPPNAYCARDPWYNDLGSHWAREYVRVLWEESVTDGYVSSVDLSVAKYYPEDFTVRAQFAILLCKVFGLPTANPSTPTYPDVPKNYMFYWNKPGWELIEGAYAGGIIFVSPGQNFKPNDKITREDAVELLIRSLDLEDYASSLTEVEIKEILRRFYDYGAVSQERRASMACAIKMGIIKGYEDGSIRPRDYLARGEAATVVARSCMIRMAARQAFLTPDGDGINDTVTFDLTYLKNRGIYSWQAAIEDSLGRIVKYLGSPGTSGQPPATLIWNGTDSTGTKVTDGTYYYQALVTDNAGRQHVSVRRPLATYRIVLQAWLSPATCADGQILNLGAATSPAATWVRATFADGVSRSLFNNSSGTSWYINIAIGPFLPAGSQEVRVTGLISGVERSVSVHFTRVEDMWIDPRVTPNPASWGQRVTLVCRASSTVSSASASIFGDTEPLVKIGEEWQGDAVVPWGAPIGLYPVHFIARSPSSSKEATVILTVEGPDISGLAYILSK